jgi:hypothetical protein
MASSTFGFTFYTGLFRKVVSPFIAGILFWGAAEKLVDDIHRHSVLQFVLNT